MVPVNGTGPGSGRPLPTWSTYTTFGRRYGLLVAACMVLGSLLGTWSALLRPATYSATASVAVAPVPSYVSLEPSVLPAQVTVDTDAALVGSQAVTRAVASAVGSAPRTVRMGLLVTAAPLTRVLQITYTAGSARQAAVGASAAAAAYLVARRASLAALQTSQLRLLSLRIAATQDRLDALRTASRVLRPDNPLLVELVALRRRLLELQTARAAPAEVLRRATVPTTRDPAGAEVPVTSGAMLGLLVGCAVGAARNAATRSGYRQSTLLPPIAAYTRPSRRARVVQEG